MRRRWGFALWLLAVLALHGWLALRRPPERQLDAPPPRLRVTLDQTLQLRPPPRLLAAAAPRRPVVRATALPQASLLPSPLPLPVWPALPEWGAEPSADKDAEFAAAPQAREGEPGPEWPPSTRLRYRVEGHFRGPVHGDAEVEWLRQGLRYQVRLRIQIGPSLAPILSRELLSEGSIGERGIEPERYVERTRLLLGQPREAGLRLEGGWLEFAGGRREPAPPGTQDSASQFVQMAWLLLSGRQALEQGGEIELPLALPRQLLSWRYELVGSETLDTVLGPLDAWHLRPGGDAPPGALRAEVWLAPQARFLPVQFHISQAAAQPGDAAWLRLSLAEPPRQEAENAPSQSAASSP